MFRDIQIKVAQSNPRFDWINTDDFNDGFDRKGKAIKNDYVLLGQERHDVGRPKSVGYPIRGIVKKALCI